MSKGVELIGLDDIQDVLGDLLPKEANNLSRTFVFGLAQEAAREIKKGVPVDDGTLKKSIKAKRRRGKPGQPVADVIATQGKGAKYNGFYWRFVEHGTGGDNPQPAQPFVRPAKDKIQANMPDIAHKVFIDKLAKQVARAKKRRSKSK